VTRKQKKKGSKLDLDKKNQDKTIAKPKKKEKPENFLGVKDEKKEINTKSSTSKPIRVPKKRVEKKEVVENKQTKKEQFNDSSLNYNTVIAVAKLKSLDSVEKVMAFVKGDTRVTVTRAVEIVIRGLTS
jgi:hypothetical protein